jgi:hypothetical protein
MIGRSRHGKGGKAVAGEEQAVTGSRPVWKPPGGVSQQDVVGHAHAAAAQHAIAQGHARKRGGGASRQKEPGEQRASGAPQKCSGP